MVLPHKHTHIDADEYTLLFFQQETPRLIPRPPDSELHTSRVYKKTFLLLGSKGRPSSFFIAELKQKRRRRKITVKDSSLRKICNGGREARGQERKAFRRKVKINVFELVSALPGVRLLGDSFCFPAGMFCAACCID